jgi:hypothetical protein
MCLCFCVRFRSVWWSGHPRITGLHADAAVTCENACRTWGGTPRRVMGPCPDGVRGMRSVMARLCRTGRRRPPTERPDPGEPPCRCHLWSSPQRS